jgi:hypothetical protein
LTEIDDEERTNSVGLFNSAEAWRLSAMALQAQRVQSGHADQPVRFLYCHAIELYFATPEVRREEALRHRSQNEAAAEGCPDHGLIITDDDAAVFSLIGDTDVLIEFRYIRTGAKTWPTLEELNRACNNIRNCVGNLLQKNKLPVRL